MSSSPNNFNKVVEANRSLIKQVKKLQEENQSLKKELGGKTTKAPKHTNH